MFKCSRCQVTAIVLYIDRDAGDWIVGCENCGAKNMLGQSAVGQLNMSLLEVIGWRD